MIPIPPGSGTVGRLIRRYRQLAGLTQDELGEKAGLSVRAVRNLEQDRVQRPRRSTLKRLASVLGMSELDPTRPTSGAQVIELPGAIVTTAESYTVSKDELSHLQPILAQVAEQFQPGQILVVQVRIACPACATPPEVKARSAEWRIERRRRALSAQHAKQARAVGTPPNGQHQGS